MSESSTFVPHGWTAASDGKTRAGGQATILRVVRDADGKVAALKCLHPDDLKSSERRERMAREVRLLVSLHGHGVPAVLECNTEVADSLGHPPYAILEWVDGQTLQDYAGGRGLALDEALSIVIELTSILGRCHEAGVVHRDVKPDNVLLERGTKRLVLIDFGIAWSTAQEDEGATLTEMSQDLGNRFLRLPDLMAGRQRHDARIDLTFAVGILFFLLTGRAPRTLLDEQARPPHEAMAAAFPGHVRSDVRWFLIRRIFTVGFEAPVELRFQSADALLERLVGARNFVPGQPDAPSLLRSSLEGWDALVSSASARALARVEAGLLECAQAVENRLEELANEAGLSSTHWAGRARVVDGGQQVDFHFRLHRRESAHPYVDLEHSLLVPLGQRAQLVASYKLQGRQEVHYHWGLAPDVEGLRESLLGEPPDLFAKCVDELTYLLEQAINRP